MPHLFYWIVGDFFFGFWQFKCHISGNLKSVISQNSIHPFSMTCKGPCHEDSSVNIALPVHPHGLQLFLVFLSQLRDDISAECPVSALENLSNTSTRIGQGGILVRCPKPPPHFVFSDVEERWLYSVLSRVTGVLTLFLRGSSDTFQVLSTACIYDFVLSLIAHSP